MMGVSHYSPYYRDPHNGTPNFRKSPIYLFLELHPESQAHSEEGKNKEAMLHSPMRGFEVGVSAKTRLPLGGTCIVTGFRAQGFAYNTVGP